MADFPFWVLVPIMGIIGWVIVTVSTTRARQQTRSSDLAKRVEDLERRIADIEKRA